jgi:putative (di)nucleoside polyphosphate hydrolase
VEDKKPNNLNIIDNQGYRLNVGIILINQDNKLLLAQRAGQNAWQFPQGGVQQGEKLYQALYRELKEELGLEPDDVTIEASTPGFLRYRLPAGLIRYDNHPLCIGQKQKWYLLRMLNADEKINLVESEKPEFQSWMWVPYWYPLKYVISFKKDVYRKALNHFGHILFDRQNDLVLDPFIVQPSLRGRQQHQQQHQNPQNH